MKTNAMKSMNRISPSLAGAALAIGLSLSVRAVDSPSPAQPAASPSAQPMERNLTAQLSELRAKVARLEAALDQNHQQRSGEMSDRRPGMSRRPGKSSAPGDDAMGAAPAPRRSAGMKSVRMAGMKNKESMGRMKKPDLKPPAGMGAMSGRSRSMSMMKPMSPGKIKMMGMMGKMKDMNLPSALPGFPGASHLYHLGATGFFLDHGTHITLTADQQAALNRIREQTLLAQNTADRKLEQAEQELWELTAADQPDARKIESKIREIEKLRGDQRWAFIRAVGAAAGVLTQDQRQALTGRQLPAPTSPNQER